MAWIFYASLDCQIPSDDASDSITRCQTLFQNKMSVKISQRGIKWWYPIVLLTQCFKILPYFSEGPDDDDIELNNVQVCSMYLFYITSTSLEKFGKYLHLFRKKEKNSTKKDQRKADQFSFSSFLHFFKSHVLLTYYSLYCAARTCCCAFSRLGKCYF